MRPGRGHPVIGEVEERLEFVTSEGTPSRITLIVRDMISGVPVMADLAGMLPETFLAFHRPAVTTIASEIAEHRHRVLIGTDSGARPARRTQRHRPFLNVGRTPPPRVLTGELLETPQCLVPTIHRRRRQRSALLLQTPAGQDRLEHRPLRAQQHRTVYQHQTRRTGHLTRSSHQHSASQPGTMLGATSLHPMQPTARMALHHNEYRPRESRSNSNTQSQILHSCSILNPAQ